MKVLFMFLALLVLVFGFLGLRRIGTEQHELWAEESRSNTKYLESLLEGKHPLRRVVQSKTIEGQFGGGGLFFFGLGAAAVDGEMQNRYVVKFAWKSNFDDDYIISSIPLERVRVRFDNDEHVTPCAEFSYPNFVPYYQDYIRRWEYQDFFDKGFIRHVTFVVSSDDWPLELEMPLSKTVQN